MADEKHLLGVNGDSWCEESGLCVNVVLEATCVTCLREAAKYGALAAVRCCGVENAGQVDEELQMERDAAVEDATVAKRALMARGLFICQQCKQTRTLSVQAGQQIPGDPPLVWCTDCSKGN